MQDGTINKSGAPYNAQSGTISAILAGSAALTESGSGLVTLTGANTYTGGTNIGNGVFEGTLAFANGSLGTTGNITFNGSVLQWLPGNTQDVSARLRRSSPAVGRVSIRAPTAV